MLNDLKRKRVPSFFCSCILCYLPYQLFVWNSYDVAFFNWMILTTSNEPSESYSNILKLY